MKCLIIADCCCATWERRSNSQVTPLTRLLGVPVIERVVRSAAAGGTDGFFVLTQDRELVEFLEGLSKRLGIDIEAVSRDDFFGTETYHEAPAIPVSKGPVLVMYWDMLLDPVVFKEMTRIGLVDHREVVLVVESKAYPHPAGRCSVRVKTDGRRLLEIGRNLKDYNGCHTGAFLCNARMFKEFESFFEGGVHLDFSWIGSLAAAGHVKVFETEKPCIALGSEESFKTAEEELLKRLRNKENDGPVSHYLNRPLSSRITKTLVKYDITPNQISLFSFILSVVASFLFMAGQYWLLALGGVLAQAASVLDGCDGEVARLKFLASKKNGWFDAVLDRYSDAMLLFGLTWYSYYGFQSPAVLVIGFLALVGSFMLSYTADKYDGLIRGRLTRMPRLGRDFRIFLVFLGAVTNHPLTALAIVAVSMNLEAVRRVGLVVLGDDKAF